MPPTGRAFCVVLVGLMLGTTSRSEERVVESVRFFPVVYPRAEPSSCVLCPKTPVPPQIDGKLGDQAWTDALIVRDFYLLGDGRKSRTAVKTTARLTFDKKHVYVAAECFDERVDELPVPTRSEIHDDRKAMKWGNSVELYFDTNGDRKSYYQIAIDLAGNVYDARYHADGKSDTSWTSALTVEPGRAPGAWTLEAAIPLTDFEGVKELDFRSWGVNVGRNQTTIPGEANTAWCGAYHNPQVFQRVMFARPGGMRPTELSYGEGAWGSNVARGKIGNLSGERKDVLAELAWESPAGQAGERGQLLSIVPRGEASFELRYEIPLSWPAAEDGQPSRRLLALRLLDPKTKEALQTSRTWVQPPPLLMLRMDRERYHFNDLSGQAVLRLNVGKAVLPKARLALEVVSEGGRVVGRQTLNGISDREAVLAVPLEHLPPARYELRGTFVVAGKTWGQGIAPFRKTSGEQREAERARVPLVVQPAQTPDGTWPVTTGVPFANGALRRPENVRLLDPPGRELPCQVRVTARWSPGGFVKWLLLDFVAHVSAKEATTYYLEYGTAVKRVARGSGVAVDETSRRVTVTTGPLRFSVRKDRFRFLESAWLDANGDGQFAADEQVLKPSDASGAYLVDHTGTRYESGGVEPTDVSLEETGPQRVVLKVSGWQAAPGGRKLGQYVTRIYAYAGQPFLRAFHTFVMTADSTKARYRDIALASTLTDLAGAIVATEKGGTCTSQTRLSLVQDAWNHFSVRGHEQKVEGQHAAGWIRADAGDVGVTVAVRDFWQNYPKEIEVVDDRLVVHFWPAHNTPRKHVLADTNRFNVHMLWFAHEGEELDFSIPTDYPTKFNRENRQEFYYIPGATQNANAIGVAKTHEMLYFFHPSDAPNEQIAATARAFQEGVACMASPEWMCSTEAFGSMPMHPRDPERFPEAEWALSAMFDFERRLERHTHDYGMWNFGDGHSWWDASDKHWQVNRTWRNTHHGAPRVPWLLYARSGDRKYLTHARRNTRHCMDVDFCHYSTPEFEALSYPRQKIKGALNDYKGLVHWHSGGRLFDYNNMADFLLYNYYLTGDRRSLDVLDEWTEAAVARFRKAYSGRGGAGPLATCIATYEHTWDHRLLPLIERYARAMIGSQQPDGLIGGWAQYAPWLNRLHRLTGSAASEECLEKWCEWYAERLKTAERYGHPHFWTVAYGYHVFGRERYLAAQAGHLRMALDAVYRKPGDLYDGYWQRGTSVSMGYLSQELPFFLHALAKHGSPVEPMYYGKQILELSSGEYRVVALDQDDRAFRFEWKGRATGSGAEYVVSAPDGTEVARGTIEPTRDKELTITVPADGQNGEYVLKLSVRRYLSMRIPMTDLPQEVFDTGRKRVTLVRDPRACFFVPEDCSRAILTIGQYRDANVASVYDGHDRLAARAQWLGTASVTTYVNLAPKPEQRGQVWAVHFGCKTKRNMLTLGKALPPYISVSRDQFFLPRAE